MGFSVLTMLIVIVKIPIFQNIYLTALLALFPFLFGGMFLATAFRLIPSRSSHIYAADLIGASIGSILIVTLLSLGGIKINLVVAIIASLPACFFIFKESASKFKRFVFPFLTGSLLLMFIVNYLGVSLGTIPLAGGSHKEMDHLLGHPAMEAGKVESRWSAFGRTDLVEVADNPDEKVFFVDGTAGTAMYRFNRDPGTLDRPEFKHFSGYFPFEILPAEKKKKVLIIGAGGGREVLVSLLGGAKEITAVEVNRDLIDLMKNYADFNGGIYNGYPGVKVVVEEGRNFIRSTRENYDIIMLSIPVTKTSRSPEGFALTENFLFTVESINDYLNRLKTDGQLIVVAHEDMEIFRLVFTTFSALKKRGISPAETMKHIYTVGPEVFPVFVLKKSPFTQQEAEKIHENMHKHNYSTHASFIPSIKQATHAIPLGEEIYQEHQMLNDALYLISQGKLSPDALLESANFDLKAVTDNDPFFYKFELGLPSILTFLLILSAIAMTCGWLIKPGYLRESEAPGKNLLFLALFSSLGIGFMLIEIPLIQKFILFLGQPAYSVAMLLFSLLVGAGIGSWLSGILWESQTLLKLRVSVIIVGTLTGLYILFLDQVFTFFLGTPFSVRIFVSFVLLLPLGLFLGMPFPLGVKLLDELGLELYIPWMWGINGIGSVLGSTLAIALAISFGFSYALFLGIIFYFSLFIIFSIGSIVDPKKHH
jgi:spermidine synthase